MKHLTHQRNAATQSECHNETVKLDKNLREATSLIVAAGDGNFRGNSSKWIIVRISQLKVILENRINNNKWPKSSFYISCKCEHHAAELIWQQFKQKRNPPLNYHFMLIKTLN